MGRLALDKRCDAIDCLEVLGAQFFVFNDNRKLLLDEPYYFQHSLRIDDTALNQRIRVADLPFPREGEGLQDELPNVGREFKPTIILFRY
jgi:hypothetical protein